MYIYISIKLKKFFNITISKMNACSEQDQWRRIRPIWIASISLIFFSRHIEWISLYNDFTTHRYETLRVRAAMYTYDTSILSQQYGKT